MEPGQVIPTMIGVLLAQPVALAAFLGALGLVLGGRLRDDVRGQGRHA